VAGAILRRFGTLAVKQATRHTATGQFVADLYQVSLSIPAPGPSAGPMLTRRDLLVMEMTQVIADIDALVGLDVLLEIKLLLDGPARSFALEF